MAGRIASLLPSVTETVCALGLRDRLVARSHECDFPPGIEDVPPVTASRLPADAVTQAQVDAAVTDSARAGEALAGERLGAFWKYRVGDWRLICDIQDERIVVRVLRLGHSREVYR